MTRLRMPRRVSKRDVANVLEFWGGGTEMQAPTKKRGPQKETAVNKVNQQWARLKGGELRRNRIGFAEIRPGVKMPFGLGTGTLDLVGPMFVRVTPEMVGHVVSIYAEVDSKTDEGVIAPHQQARIDYLRSHGAISGASTGPDDMEALYQSWLARFRGPA